jgi:mitochondrial intermembrane space import and assembly protein 40
LNPNLEAIEGEDSPSLDVLASRRRTPNKNAQNLHSAADGLSSENASTPVSNQSVAGDTISAPGSLAELEEESEGEGAFNPETGEINWDCPCLGGMAHGPCGPEFREAFSCFVFSKEEPKGMECIERFQSMRDCFQQHPEVYKDELMDDEEIDKELENERQELAQQIKERREKDLAEETGSQRRLLEESPPAPRPAKSEKKTQPSHTKKESVPSPEPVQAKDAPPKLESTQMKRSPRSSKSAQMAEESENIY